MLTSPMHSNEPGIWPEMLIWFWPTGDFKKSVHWSMMGRVELDKETNGNPNDLKKTPCSRVQTTHVALERSNLQVPKFFRWSCFPCKCWVTFLCFRKMLRRRGSFLVPWSDQRDFIWPVASVCKPEKKWSVISERARICQDFYTVLQELAICCVRSCAMEVYNLQEEGKVENTTSHFWRWGSFQIPGWRRQCLVWNW